MGEKTNTLESSQDMNQKLQYETNARTTDLTQNFVNANGGSRDLNNAYVSDFYKMLSGGGNSALLGGLQSGAKAITDQAFSPFASSMSSYAQQQSDTQRRAMEQRLAQGGILGTDSGAARSAIAKAIAQPYAEADVKMQESYGNMYQQNMANLFSGLASLSQQSLVAPQLQTSQTSGDKWANFATQAGSAAIGGATGALVGGMTGNPAAVAKGVQAGTNNNNVNTGVKK